MAHRVDAVVRAMPDAMAIPRGEQGDRLQPCRVFILMRSLRRSLSREPKPSLRRQAQLPDHTSHTRGASFLALPIRVALHPQSPVAPPTLANLPASFDRPYISASQREATPTSGFARPGATISVTGEAELGKTTLVITTVAEWTGDAGLVRRINGAAQEIVPALEDPCRAAALADVCLFTTDGVRSPPPDALRCLSRLLPDNVLRRSRKSPKQRRFIRHPWAGCKPGLWQTPRQQSHRPARQVACPTLSVRIMPRCGNVMLERSRDMRAACCLRERATCAGRPCAVMPLGDNQYPRPTFASGLNARAYRDTAAAWHYSPRPWNCKRRRRGALILGSLARWADNSDRHFSLRQAYSRGQTAESY